jgi:hypothetical protein
VGDGAERRDFPVAEVAGENDRRLAVIAQRVEQLLGPRAEFDPAWFVRMIDVVIPDVVEMGKLSADAAEIVPDAGENLLDLFGRFLGEGLGEIFTPDAILAQPAADEVGDAAEEVRGLVRVERSSPIVSAPTAASENGLAASRRRALVRRSRRFMAIAFSSEVGTGSRQENASNKKAMRVIRVRASGSAKRFARRSRTSSTSRR